MVDIDGNCSEPLDISSGVLQGSVICSFLLLVYVNDIMPTVHCSTSIHLHDDDCLLFSEIKLP